MSENISDQTFTSVVAGEEEGYVVFAQYGAAALTVDLEEVINELAARLRSVDERLALTNKRYESVCNRVVILEATTARQEREIAALRGTINSVVEGRLTDMDEEIDRLQRGVHVEGLGE